VSAIPPNWMASGIQSLDAQKRSTDAAARSAASDARAGSPPFSAELKDVIETSDRDAQVDVDGGGTGGQGRSHSDSGDSGTAPDQKHEQPDTPPSSRLDLTA
jgi:hypothetical protein